MRKYISLILLFTLWACQSDKPEPQQIIRLGKALYEYSSLDSMQRAVLCDSLHPEINAFFQLLGNDTPSDSTILAWSNSRAVRVFQPDVDSIFPNLDQLSQQLAYIERNARRDSLDLGHLTFCTITWGFNQTISKNDSIVFVALNHYLGEDYPGYSHLDTYIRREKTPDYIQYNLVEAILAMQYPFETKETPTLLNYMLYEGAILEAQMRLIHNPLLERALGYTPEQLEITEDNEHRIWEEMAIGKYIHSTDPTLIRRLTAQSPYTPFLNGTAPGKIGRYIGYRIVRQYLKKHPTTQLSYLLSPAFYDNPQTLISSGF